MKKNEEILFFSIGKKKYIAKRNNFLIVDYINLPLGKKIFFYKIDFLIQKKIIIEKFYLNLKLNAIILKHFYFKSFSIKKKRRKNFLKNIISYKKKSLIFINNIF